MPDSRWSRAALASRFRRVRDVWPVTWLGALAIGSAVCAIVFLGVRKLDLVILGLGAAALGTAAIGLLAVVGTAIGLRVSLRGRKGESVSIECTTPARLGFYVPRLRFVPLVVVRWQWLAPDAMVTLEDRRGRREEVVTGRHRGSHPAVTRRIEVRDSFGLWAVAFEVKEQRALLALPSSGAFRQIQVMRSLSGGEDFSDPSGAPEGDRSDLRAYAPGDPVRFILWRVFAKSRQLVVRSPERALSTAKKAYAYLVTGEGDEPAAGAARAAIESGALGKEWAFGTDGGSEAATSRGPAIDAIVRSGHVPREDGGAGLSRFLERSGGKARSRTVVFVPAKPGPWLARVAALAGPGVEILVCTDGIRMPGAEPDEDADGGRDVGAPDPESIWSRVTHDEIGQVLRTMGRANVRVLDRRSGRVLSAAQIALPAQRTRATEAVPARA